MNSFDNAKKSILSTVANGDNRVTVFTGGWGVGKSFVLESILKDPDCNTIFNESIYVSLFGVKSIVDLRSKIAGNYSDGYVGKMPKPKRLSGNKILEASAMAIGVIAKKVLGTAFDDGIELGLQKILPGRLVIIDDIERKMQEFCIIDLLAFINEYAERHDCRFLLVMNEFELLDRNSWRIYFEKVIDKRISLNPTSEELADIAKGRYSGIHITAARDSVVHLGWNP